ncbi:retrovirus-related pol polyprotein line-1 [Plakobranchus ocellatus]|uniref:Retrovirus-related pol polyprotein line-1 n=1 Tax=Plakobranchus ocellatus TaxID=259542 RepID=A0AAV4CTW8_9GAST|nr:retrovirus-related pol polyprotein line-1 [Plakobranchus ocellatus]
MYGEKATSAVFLNNHTGRWFRKAVGVCQGCLLYPTLFNIFLERIITETLEDHEDTEKRIKALEIRCLRKLLGITYHHRITNEEVKNRVQSAIGPYTDLLTIVQQHKLKWYGHVPLSSGLAKTIMQSTVQGGRRRGRQRKR